MAARPPGAPPTVERLRITPLSAARAVGMLGLTLVGLRLFAASQRVIGWILVAAAVAGLLHPFVAGLTRRRLPRGAAVAIVAVSTVACVALATYGLVDSVRRETRALQEAAPRRAAQLEARGRFADVASELDLSRRTDRFVTEIPKRLRGGSTADALRSAATRGVAFLATGVLALFFLLHGGRLAEAALQQVHDEAQRERVRRVGLRAYHRAFGYARGSILMALSAGMLTYLLARFADVPGPVPLALWVALWDIVPVVGAAIGALPVVALAAAASPGKAAFLAVVFVAYQVLEDLVLQAQIERMTMRLGPFLTAAAGFAGLELYGIGGALLLVLAVALLVAIADDLATDDIGSSLVDRGGRSSEGR